LPNRGGKEEENNRERKGLTCRCEGKGWNCWSGQNTKIRRENKTNIRHKPVELGNSNMNTKYISTFCVPLHLYHCVPHSESTPPYHIARDCITKET
jgi:hypothetical protein